MTYQFFISYVSCYDCGITYQRNMKHECSGMFGKEASKK